MKTTFSFLGIVFLLLSFTLNAQQPTKPSNPTVDSILSKYNLQPMPAPMTTDQIFPVIGTYQSSTNQNDKLTVVLDDQNKGFVWIDGLPQGRAKAILKKSPSTYKIVSQKTADGKQIPEGTLIYDKDANVIHVMLGMPFNDENPEAVFSTSSEPQPTQEVVVTKTKGNKTKEKEKVKKVETWTFTGSKVQGATASNQ